MDIQDNKNEIQHICKWFYQSILMISSWIPNDIKLILPDKIKMICPV